MLVARFRLPVPLSSLGVTVASMGQPNGRTEGRRTWGKVFDSARLVLGTGPHIGLESPCTLRGASRPFSRFALDPSNSNFPYRLEVHESRPLEPPKHFLGRVSS